MGLFFRKFAGLSLTALCVVALGCESNGGGTPPTSTSKTEVNVSGTVTVKGKPATGGKITFDATNINRKDVQPTSADIGKDGKYSAKTYPGDNGVQISGVPGQAMLFRQRKEISEGDNTYDVELEAAPK